MRILILGVSGFLGGRFAAALLRGGHEVIGVSRGERPAELPGEVRHVRCAIDDAARLEPALAGADYVLHLAWDTTPGTSAGRPALETELNLLPTTRLIELLQRHPHCRLVFVSSGGALYASTAAPATETTPVAPRSCYGAAKIAAETMLRAANAQNGLSAIVLRPSNAYGPGQHAQRQFAIVPTLMQCARDGTPFPLWGDGSTVRDYVHIGDLERLIEAVIAQPWPQACFEIMNAGSGSGISIDALCAAVQQASGRELARSRMPARAVDIPHIVLDSSHALALLGWSATTPLEAGLRETWNWLATKG